MSPAPVSVGRVRVEDVRHDPLATRVTLDRLLATAALRPQGLPPSAILVVRTLRDPLPRRLRLDRTGIRPPPEWEHAVAASLDDLARGAARPAHEAVGANAAAVLFADRAELLACLLADWAAGVITSRWWWRLVVRGSPETAVPAELRASPTYVPAAFAALAQRGVAVAVAASLPPEEALAIARSVAATFGVALPQVDEVRAEEQPTEPVVPGLPFERLSREHDAPPAAPAWSTIVAKLLPSVPEARASGLRAEQRLLLAVALGLRRAPAALRLPIEPPPGQPPQATPTAPKSPRQALAPPPGAEHARPPASAASTVPAPRTEGGRTGASAADRSQSEPPRADRAPQRAADALEPATPAPESPTVAARPGPERSSVRVEPWTESPSAPSHEPETTPPPHAPVAPPPQTRATAHARELADAPAAESVPAAPPRLPESAPEPVPLFGPAVETRLGGLFFLVNVGIDLGLYGDFTQPDRPGIALDLWDFLTLAGKRLTSGADDDPVWRLLAELAGRDPEDPPGAGFVPPGGETLAEWALATADEIHAVLAASDLPPSRLLRRPAAVHVTEAHIDVVFALAGHPLEIRIAGLDRDPGFVPAAGRHVAFHFE